MRKRFLIDERGDPMGLFMDPIMDFIGLMFFMVIFLLISMRKSPEPSPLRFLATEPPPCGVGLPYVLTLAVQGGSGDRTFSCPDQEALRDLGLSLDPKSGTVHGTVRTGSPSEELTALAALLAQHHPLAIAASSSILLEPGPKPRTIRFAVQDDRGKSASAAFTFRVQLSAYPVSTEDTQVRLLGKGAQLPPARVGVPYEAVLGARGGLGKINWNGSKDLHGLTLADGRVFGVPTAAGSFTLAAQGEFRRGHAKVGREVVEWRGGADTAAYSLKVLPPLQTQTLPFARVGEVWSAHLFTTPLLPGETLQFEELPEWISHPSEDILTGLPKRTGEFTIRFRVRARGAADRPGTLTGRVLPESLQPQVDVLVVTGRVGEPFRTSIPYRGLVEPVTVSSSSTMPPELSWVGAALAGKPAKPGDSKLAVKLTDAVGTVVETTVLVRILPPKEPLKVAAPAVIDLVVGTPLSWRLPTSGGEAAGTVEAESDLPPGCRIKDGVLDGAVKESGKWKIMLRATDPVTGERVRQELLVRGNFAVSDQLVVATGSLPRAFVGEEYAVALAATGAAGPVTWSAEGLPRWMRLDGGILRGKPTLEGKTTFKVVARDAAGRKTAARTLELVSEKPERSKLVVLTAALPAALAGQSYSVDLAAQGGLGACRWHLEGKLPEGLQPENGRLQGIPLSSSVGKWPLKVRAEDERGERSEDRELVLEVMRSARLEDFTILTRALPRGVVGEGYDVTLAATGAAGPVTWTVQGLPRELRHEAGRVRGILAERGAGRVNVSARDSAGREAGPIDLEFSAVQPETTVPEVVTRAVPRAAVGKTYATYLAAEGGLGRYRWKVEGRLPPRMRLVENRLEGTPAKEDIGTWPLTVSVEDERGVSSKRQAVTLEIEELVAPGEPPASTPGPHVVDAREALYLAAGFAAGVLPTLVWTWRRRGVKRKADPAPGLQERAPIAPPPATGAGRGADPDPGQERAPGLGVDQKADKKNVANTRATTPSASKSKVIHFCCSHPGCKGKLKVPAQRGGQWITCRFCGGVVIVPQEP